MHWIPPKPIPLEIMPRIEEEITEEEEVARLRREFRRFSHEEMPDTLETLRMEVVRHQALYIARKRAEQGLGTTIGDIVNIFKAEALERMRNRQAREDESEFITRRPRNSAASTSHVDVPTSTYTS